ncbi:hypothetical protein Sru01_37200 [Sphaerisporangium rufum]|uniref:Subtilisin inhibitor domain-containing protein n=1 Tax=Sphaerisporangium rufum TaxID=1381558 RepID=A0A919R3P8_9ACTN|nr:SSI family serine proteinase inhibitor [Sphaerisporangium rufum]GII78738.1 hypothetical protein Sru01_37200 [Sphaerisporangium rufum]
MRSHRRHLASGATLTAATLTGATLTGVILAGRPALADIRADRPAFADAGAGRSALADAGPGPDAPPAAAGTGTGTGTAMIPKVAGGRTPPVDGAGGGDDRTAGTTRSATIRKAGTAPVTRALVLSVNPGPVVWPPDRVAVLDCGSSAGSHPRPREACAELTRVNGDIGRLRPSDTTACPTTYAPVTFWAVGVWGPRTISGLRVFTNQCSMLVTLRSVAAF